MTLKLPELSYVLVGRAFFFFKWNRGGEKATNQWNKPWKNGSHVKKLISLCQIPCESNSRKFKLLLPNAWTVWEPRRKRRTRWETLAGSPGWLGRTNFPNLIWSQRESGDSKARQKDNCSRASGLLISHALTHQPGLIPGRGSERHRGAHRTGCLASGKPRSQSRWQGQWKRLVITPPTLKLSSEGGPGIPITDWHPTGGAAWLLLMGTVGSLWWVGNKSYLGD